MMTESSEESEQLSLEDLYVQLQKEQDGYDSDPDDFEKVNTRKKEKKKTDKEQTDYNYNALENKDPYEVDPIPEQFKFDEECLPHHKDAERRQKKESK